MNQEPPLFKFADMPVSVNRSAIYGSFVLFTVLTIVSLLLTGLTPVDAVLAALLGVVLHWVGVLVHNYGHFFFAKRIGYPSTGLTLRLAFARINYPPDEGKLTPQIHIKRALSGPFFSLIWALMVAPVIVLWLIPMGGIGQYLGYWLLLDYGWVFTFGALFPPMRFDWFTNDGGTLWIIWERSLKRSRRVS